MTRILLFTHVNCSSGVSRIFIFHENTHATRVQHSPRKNWVPYPKITRERLPWESGLYGGLTLSVFISLGFSN